MISLMAFGAIALSAEPPAPTPAENTDDLYKIGQQLFDQYAPSEIKEQYAFPSRDDWDVFAGRLQHALENDSLEGLASYGPEAQAALRALRSIPGDGDYADWLSSRIDEIEGAKEAVAQAGTPLPRAIGNMGPSLRIPHYELWLRRENARPIPARAAELMPQLRKSFAAEGVPPQLAWIAEVESNLNPEARSPAGAKGLFQLMPDTAHALGLGTILPDQRSDPEKSARAAARYLHMLFAKFGSWPLALAAYNAGEGRVSRLLTARSSTDFAGIESGLPSETRMYVPKVCALVAVRTGTAL
jgi:membrane-bound lytic murein transglycosylase D